MKPATNRFAGLLYRSSGEPICWMMPLFHDDDLVAHGHGLDLVVGDVDHGRLEARVER